MNRSFPPWSVVRGVHTHQTRHSDRSSAKNNPAKFPAVVGIDGGGHQHRFIVASACDLSPSHPQRLVAYQRHQDMQKRFDTFRCGRDDARPAVGRR
jgi:hypothetical protein